MSKIIRRLVAVYLASVASWAPSLSAQPKADSSQAKVESKAFGVTLAALLSHSVQEINVQDVTAEMDALFLDARKKREYEVSHIKDARWVGYDHFDTARVSGTPKDQRIIVYCSVGYRSEKITERLMEAGYTAVANLYGGIFEWKNQGRPVYNQDGPTEDVHAYNRAWGVWLHKGRKVYK